MKAVQAHKIAGALSPAALCSVLLLLLLRVLTQCALLLCMCTMFVVGICVSCVLALLFVMCSLWGVGRLTHSSPHFIAVHFPPTTRGMYVFHWGGMSHGLLGAGGAVKVMPNWIETRNRGKGAQLLHFPIPTPQFSCGHHMYPLQYFTAGVSNPLINPKKEERPSFWWLVSFLGRTIG